jgi:uncharacterized protein YPO0396
MPTARTNASPPPVVARAAPCRSSPHSYTARRSSTCSAASYTTLFLDEALIKADGRYTQRALTVLPRLGFQVIVSAPESKTGEILEVSTKAYVTYKDPDTGLTSLREAVLYQNDMDDESSSDISKDDGVAE